MRRWRPFVALLCVAVIAAGVVVSANGSHDLLAVLVPVWQEFQPAPVLVADVVIAAPVEQLVAHRSHPAFRGPPPARPA